MTDQDRSDFVAILDTIKLQSALIKHAPANNSRIETYGPYSEHNLLDTHLYFVAALTRQQVDMDVVSGGGGMGNKI